MVWTMFFYSTTCSFVLLHFSPWTINSVKSVLQFYILSQIHITLVVKSHDRCCKVFCTFSKILFVSFFYDIYMLSKRLQTFFVVAFVGIVNDFCCKLICSQNCCLIIFICWEHMMFGCKCLLLLLKLLVIFFGKSIFSSFLFSYFL
jgi:hypothetical protein